MAPNWFITGPPGVGKTTALLATADRLESVGWDVEGIIAPERLDATGDRTGFDIAAYGETPRKVMSSVDRSSGPQVGRYRVDTDAIDAVITHVLPAARHAADLIVIDELGPMQFTSERFVAEVSSTLAGPVPTLATVKETHLETYLGRVGADAHGAQIVVTHENRSTLPAELATTIASSVDP